MRVVFDGECLYTYRSVVVHTPELLRIRPQPNAGRDHALAPAKDQLPRLREVVLWAWETTALVDIEELLLA